MSAITAALSEAAGSPQVPLEKLEAARRERDALKRLAGRLEADKASLEARLEALLEMDGATTIVPDWITDVKSSNKTKRGVATLFISDTHFDEVVNPEEVEGLNAYNRKIATLRLRAAFQKSALMTSQYVTGVKCESAVVFLGGDIVGGTIHDELVQSNDAFITETVLYYVAELAAGIEFMKLTYKKVLVVCVVGNHGRLSMKPRHKGRVKDNWDWLIYKMLAREFKNDKNVEFIIPDSSDATVDVCGYRFRLTHGDQFRGGGGQSGIATPITTGDRKKRQLAMATDNPYDFLCFSGDTTVVTERGIKRISEVSVGDLVLTHTGNWKPVYDTKQREAETIVVKGHGHPGLVTTPEHPFWASEREVKSNKAHFSEPEWVEAQNLLGKFWHSPASTPEPLERPLVSFDSPINKVFTQDESFWFVVGLWLADGHILKQKGEHGDYDYLVGISLALNANQRSEFEELMSSSDMRFSYIDKTYRGVAQFQSYSNPLAVWLRDNFGEYAAGKTLPGWVLSMGSNERQALLDGYLFGDGHFPERHRWEASTVSKPLAIGIKLLAQTLGQHTTLFYDDRGGTGGAIKGVSFVQRPRWKVKGTVTPQRHAGSYFHDGNILGRVKSIAVGATQTVYNLSVADDESFIADGLVVHNCLGHWHQYTLYNNIIVNGCFPAGSKVITMSGFSNIEDVRVGDTIMSRDGSEQKVVTTFTHPSERLVGFKVAGLPEVVQATPNHQVLAVKNNSSQTKVPPSRRSLIDRPHGDPQWIPADFLSPGDYVNVPFPRGSERPVDEETAWAYGLYLAKGSALLDGGSTKNHNRVVISMHRNEVQILERWCDWFEKMFGKRPRIYLGNPDKGKANNADAIVSAGSDTSVWFRETFGHGAHNKHLPDGALLWDDELKRSLLNGWIDGDGCRVPQDDCRPTVSATTVSSKLAWGMFYISPANQTWPSLSVLRAGGPRKSDTFMVHQNVGQSVIVVDGEAFYQINERFETPSSAPVFDLEVTGEHTYVVGGIGVHNSSKGMDEYAYHNGFTYSEPSQAFWITTPEHGVTFPIELKVMDRKAEGW